MQTSSATPQWAVDLAKQVCKDYKRAELKKLQWYSGDSEWSSGFTLRIESKIHITAGHNQYDQELVLLHELAHYLLHKTEKGRKANHNLRFWKLAFELYSRYGIDLAFAFYREEHYKKTAAKGYQYILAKEQD